MKSLVTFASLAVVMAMTGPAFADGDAAVGAETFKKKCKACHSVEPGENKGGPSLAGIIGRQVASTDFDKYESLKDMNFVWDEAQLDTFLADPKKFVGGGKTMAIKLKKEDERADVIAYLKSLQ
jgi:cytochrome c